MYSGGENSGDSLNGRSQFTNWQFATQPAAAMQAASNVDWAIIAQQWIKMRETNVPGYCTMPDAPPPPMISNKSYHPKALSNFDEQGEADMEVDKDDEFDQHLLTPSAMHSNSSQLGNTSHVKQFGQIWSIQPHPLQQINVPPQQSQQWDWPARVALPPPALHVPTIDAVTTTQTIPLLKTPDMPAPSSSTLDKNDSPGLDAAKRKMLPAWIREGLEKMEKEKLKQMEKSSSQKEDDNNEKHINTDLKQMVKSSIIAMDSDKSGSEDEEDFAPTAETLPNSIARTASPEKCLAPASDEDSGKTHDEIVKDLMLVVRRTLTEVLLEVTNEEIASIAQDTFKRQKSKASSAQVIRKSAISTITGKLGLGAYADSSSESNDSDGNNSNASDHGEDSEEEIRANMRSRRRAFVAIEEGIEDMLAEDETRTEQRRREREKSLKDKRDHEKDAMEKDIASAEICSSTYEREIGETQPDKKYYSNGGKRSKERTSRFSDNKDNKYKSGSSYFVPPNPVTVSNITISATQVSNNSNTASSSSSNATTKSRDSEKSQHKSSRHHRRSYSSDSSDDSYDRRSSSSSKYKRSSRNTKSSSSHSKIAKSHRRRYSSDSDEDSRKKSKHHKSSHSSRRRRDSDSKSRSRSRSQSRSSYSSSKRSERY